MGTRANGGASQPPVSFLGRRMAFALAGGLLLAYTLSPFLVGGDGLAYFHVLQSLVDGGSPQEHVREFGSIFFVLPFYGVARLFSHTTGVCCFQGAPLPELAVTVSTAGALLLTLYLGWRLLRELDLPAGPGVLLVTLAGSPLLYYTLFQPSYKHAVDALLTTAFVLLLLAVVRGARKPWLLPALGCSFGWLVSVRFANAALAVALAVALGLRARRPLGVVARSAVATAALLLSVPRMADSLRAERDAPAPARSAAVLALPPTASLLHPCRDDVPTTLTQCLRNKLGVHFAPLAPVRMLFSLRRGLFLWTPLTALAIAGLVLAARRLRDRFLVALGLGAVALLLSHIVWGDFWTGGFSFSQRYLASLYPLYVVGVAELVRRFGRRAAAALAVCAAFSSAVAVALFVAYPDRLSERDGVDDVVRLYVQSGSFRHELVHSLAERAEGRWGW